MIRRIFDLEAAEEKLLFTDQSSEEEDKQKEIESEDVFHSVEGVDKLVTEVEDKKKEKAELETKISELQKKIEVAADGGTVKSLQKEKEQLEKELETKKAELEISDRE